MVVWDRDCILNLNLHQYFNIRVLFGLKYDSRVKIY